ncbi:MAG: universal stress protein [Desulfobacterales bacterium]|nr:MAG: universal stress protein [Desulfobacterales bacterium]
MYKKILIPLEGTENDKIVLEHVRRMAKQSAAALVLIQLHRVLKEHDPGLQKIQMEVGSAGYLKKEKAEAYLAELEQSLRKEGIQISKEFIVTTEPEADTIVKYGEEKGCDLVALTNQHRTGLGRWFFLNIEEKVKRRSSLPVLLVAGPKDKEKS